MKIALISPLRNADRRKPKGIFMPQLSLHLIAGLTPEEHEVHTIEEERESIDFNEWYDLVGISCMTSNAPRAYELAKGFRERGAKVVLGGIHPSIMPEEAIRHADAVVIGEAEGVWEDVLKDAQANKLRKTYRKDNPTLDMYIPVRYPKKSRKRILSIIPVMTTKGCPYDCEFCSVHTIYGRKIRHIPVRNVVRYIRETPGKLYMFLDDNIVGDVRYARELFTALKPLKIKWVGQASVSLAKNVDLIRMAVQSGCFGLFFGVETVTTAQAEKMTKSHNNLKDTEEAIKRIADLGIHFHPSMILGFDDDTKGIFEETLEFLYRNKISTASMNVLTPYPGTEIFKQYAEEGRLITRNWRHYNHNTPVYKPKKMSPRELYEGRLWAVKEFSKFSSVLKRLPYHLHVAIYHMMVNKACLQAIQIEIDNFPTVSKELYAV